MVTYLNLSFLDDLDSTIEFLDVEKLTVDPKVQRPEDLNKIRRIYKRFTPSGVGTLLVSRRADGDQVVLDGQTRLAVLNRKLKEGGPTQVRCEVFDNLTEEQEAALFVTHNDGTKPRATDRFRITGVAGDKTVREILEIVTNHGYKVSTFPADGSIAAVTAMERIYRISVKNKREPNTLELALIVLKRAYGQDYDATRGVVLEGVAAILEEYGSRVDVARLVEKMREIPERAKGLLNEAYSWAKIQKMRPTMALAAVLVFKYNEGARGGRKALPEWRRRGYYVPRG
jgi:hypothetical protein